MAEDECKPVAVSRRIDAAAPEIFAILANPGRHLDLDGSGMLREGGSNTIVVGIGDIFVMKMHSQALGDYEMNNHIVEYELNRRIGWEPELRDVDLPDGAPLPIGNRPGQRWSFELMPDGPNATVVTEIYDCSRAPELVRTIVDNGNGWIESMAKTLERLAGLCATRPEEDGGGHLSS
jgi:hypothetical protein